MPSTQTPTQTPKMEPAEIAKRLRELTDADLASTLAIMAGLCKAIRENSPGRMRPAKGGEDALRIEMAKWRTELLKGEEGDDVIGKLLAAGAEAAKG